MKWYNCLILLLVLFSSGGCRTEYIPIESIRYDSIFFGKLMKDSVYVKDSVYIRDRGDTIFKFKNKYVYVYKDRVDTFFVYRDKEIKIPVPVERKLSWWERQKIDYGGWAMLILIAAMLIKIRRWLARITRKE